MERGERSLVNAFIASAIPKHRQARWREILGGNVKKWGKLSMDDLWGEVGKSDRLALVDIEKYLARHDALASQAAVLFRLSGGGAVMKGCVADLVNEIAFDDCLLLAPDSTTSLASHHCGEWLRLTEKLVTRSD